MAYSIKQPLLSLCIPTYNRSQYLKQALESLVSNRDFDDEVEGVKSDHCSTDETEQIGKDYASNFSNIKYYRNPENIWDSNFCLAMDRATGEYVKLMNDNHVICAGSLHYMKERIKKHIKDRTALFFTGVVFNHPKTDECICHNFEDFVIHLSYYVTAIHCFGAWKEDWDKVEDRTKYSKLHLNQDDWAYQIVENKSKCILYTGVIANSLVIQGKHRSGYNWFDVHVENYYKLLQPYVDKGLLSPRGIRKEKNTYLIGLRDPLTVKYLYNILPDWHFDMSGATSILWRHFKDVPLFYAMMVTLPIWGGIKTVLFLLRKYDILKG